MLRTLTRQSPLFTSSVRGFKTSAAAFVKAGDSVPSLTLHENSPGNTVDLAEETKTGKYVIIGVPGAYSPACSASHVPGYISRGGELAAKGVDGVFVVAVNDSFVTKAWGAELTQGKDSKVPVRFIADHAGDFATKWDVLFDASKFFGNKRSKRYAAVVENGKVQNAWIEPDSTGLDVSTAEKVVGQL
ncbi:Redoxin [Nadsonia fulvescens var. elongata DSM 6958]|uniref:Redoxin n=1 Tax=Nadsonia fulvescens var. elongata DSM 6958 TaxID=857566 RepID=A0A1E3PCM2_9ASCO|nr:Redoxin [Nadsonia fulvescens var. elongata DSM 6958]